MEEGSLGGDRVGGDDLGAGEANPPGRCFVSRKELQGLSPPGLGLESIERP